MCDCQDLVTAFPFHKTEKDAHPDLREVTFNNPQSQPYFKRMLDFEKSLIVLLLQCRRLNFMKRYIQEYDRKGLTGGRPQNEKYEAHLLAVSFIHYASMTAARQQVQMISPYFISLPNCKRKKFLEIILKLNC